MEVTRRQFLKGAAAVPAVALIPNVILKRVPKPKLERKPGTQTKTFHAVTGNPKGVEFRQTTDGLEPALIDWDEDTIDVMLWDNPHAGLPVTPNGGDITVMWNDDDLEYAF